MSNEIVIARPTTRDAQAMWHIVRDSGVLDLNSFYLYVLLCRHYAGSCAVARWQGEVVAFVTAYLRPDQPQILFLWQVGVAAEWRRRGLAKALIHDILDRDDLAGIRFLEATVSPSNVASQALMGALSRELGATLTKTIFLGNEDFPEELSSHEAELLFRIGRIGN